MAFLAGQTYGTVSLQLVLSLCRSLRCSLQFPGDVREPRSKDPDGRLSIAGVYP